MRFSEANQKHKGIPKEILPQKQKKVTGGIEKVLSGKQRNDQTKKCFKMAKAKTSSGDWSRTHDYLRGIPENERTTSRIVRTKKAVGDHYEHNEVKAFIGGALVWHCKDGNVITDVRTA